MTAGSSREEVLSNIRRALRGEGHPAPAQPGKAPSTRGQLDQSVLEIKRRCERQRGALIEQFELELARVRGRFHKANADSALEYIFRVAEETQASTVIGWDTDLIGGVSLSNRLEARGIKFLTEATDREFTRSAATVQIGISGIDFALADTGTLVLLTRKGRARAISLLPPVHIALMRPAQIISGLDDLFPLLRSETDAAGEGLSSAITFITGPSRTADIELTLVVGVHGPQQLHVLLLDS